jgi:hypothetical protein
MQTQLTKCNQGFTGENKYIKNKEQEEIVHYLRKKNYLKPKNHSRVLFRMSKPERWIVVEKSKAIMTQTSDTSALFRKNIEEGKVLKFKEFMLLICKEEEPDKDEERLIEAAKKIKATVQRKQWESESIMSLMKNIFNVSSYTMRTIYEMTTDMKSIGWLLQVLTILVDVRDPYTMGLTKLFTILIRIIGVILQLSGSYNDYVRPKIRSESLTLTDTVLMLSVAGLPHKLISKVEVFSKLTGKRFSDSGFLMSIVSEFLDIVLSLLEWAASKDPTEYGKYFVDKLRAQLSFVTTYKLVKEMTEVVATYHKNQQSVLDVQFRVKCQELHTLIKEHLPTLTFCRDSTNRISYQLWMDFVSIMVLVKNYSVSSRMEPVCVVFEGSAGVGKSTFMNKIVAAMKHANYSVYCHTVPDINAGKDFYDDYMNQDVFVMDDVGQQGKSQWRSIINFVAPVKYPLECASAEKKNTKFFASPLILCTTNSFMELGGFTSRDCISEPEALFRRCHVLKFDAPTKIKYYKYDYRQQKIWKQEKISPWLDCEFPTVFNKDDRTNLRDVFRMIKELLETQKSFDVENTMPDRELDYITAEDDFKDAVSTLTDADRIIVPTVKVEHQRTTLRSETLEDLRETGWEPSYQEELSLQQGRRQLRKSRFRQLMEKGRSAVSEVVEYLAEKVQRIKEIRPDNTRALLGIAAISTVVTFIFYTIYGMSGKIDENDDAAGIGDVINDWKKAGPETHKMFSETGSDRIATEDETNNTRKYFRFFEIFYYHEGIMKTDYCQGAVSGKYVLLPLHALGDNITMNIFRDWDRYQSKQYEFNLVPAKIHISYVHLDVAIVELLNLPVVPFKNANMIFKREAQKTFSNELYFCNSFHKIRNIYGTNIRMCREPFRVVNYRKELSFGADSGLIYGISALGLCGSLIIDRMNGFVGMHVAGNGTDGFSVVPSTEIRKEIADIMLSSSDPNFEHREGFERENFSGSRLTYDTAQLSMAMQKSNFKPTVLNARGNEQMKKVCEDYGVPPKEPANVNKYGKPTQTLKVCSQKSFSPIKPIEKEELEFAKSCLRTFMCEFTDLTDQETAFGDGRNIAAINKDAANGYGYKPKKTDYFDFENKVITQEFLDIVKAFEKRADEGSLKWEDVVAKEALKDEMRPVGKDPRTFRIMPLHHMFIMKKTMGKLFSHVRDNMWSNGIAIGMNPYRDWPRLYEQIRKMHAVFALDFGKWDGSCHAQIQDLVSEVVLQFYRGEHRTSLKAVLDSVIRGFTLVNDELLMTTHSLPSGAWITAFFNSLINRAITAITIFREMKKENKTAKVVDFYACVDFVLGDDKLSGCPETHAKYFNAFTLRDCAESLGMTVTDCNKKPITTKFHNIEDVSFLKRTFRTHEKLGLVGPLSLETLLTTLQWFDCTKDYDTVMEGKSVVLQIESYIHSPTMLVLFKDLMKDYSWYREYSEGRILKVLEDSDEVFTFVRDALDKKY